MTEIFNEKTEIKGVVDTGAEIINDGLSSVDVRAVTILDQILTELKKIEFHMSIATDTNLNDQDVGG